MGIVIRLRTRDKGGVTLIVVICYYPRSACVTWFKFKLSCLLMSIWYVSLSTG